MCWEHLKPIASELLPYKKDMEVGLLIGTNCPRTIKPREILPGSDNDPYEIKTDLNLTMEFGLTRSLPKN